MKDNDLLICTLEEKLRIATEALESSLDAKKVFNLSSHRILVREALYMIKMCDTQGGDS